MPRKGKTLERLVEHLERALAPDEGVTIESPRYFKDTSSGQRREHDVVLTIDRGHHSLVIAIECRDGKRKVGSPDVEAFKLKCVDTGIESGVIVSSSGFAKPAVKKAARYDIRCLTLDEVEGFDWFLAPGIEMRELKISRADFRVVPTNPADVPDDSTEWHLETAEGDIISHEIMLGNVRQQLSKFFQDPDIPEEFRTDFRFGGSNILAVENATGKKHDLKGIIADVFVTVTKEIAPVKLVKYSDVGDGMAIADAAVAAIEFKGFSGKLMAVRSGDTTKIVFAPAKKDEKN